MTSASPENISLCIRSLLRPVLRMCLRRVLKLTDIIELIKIELVQIAQEELADAGGEVSLSKLSAMTGVHRKDVTRIVRESTEPKQSKNIIAKVMVQWQHDGLFTTKAGRPRQLQCDGKESEFAQLVHSVNGGNLSPYTVLNEMERMGAVERRGDRVKLCWQDFAPPVSDVEGLTMLAEDSADMHQAVDENIERKDSVPNLHLKTEFDRVPESAIPAIREWLLKEGSRFHKRVREYLSQYDNAFEKGSSPAEATRTVSFGSFSLVKPEWSIGKG